MTHPNLSLNSDDASPRNPGRRQRRSRRAVLGLALLALAVTAACAPQDEADDEAGATPSASGPAACTADALETVEDGTFTIATGEPAYEPWFKDDDPANGQGFESAVAYAVAEELGFTKDQVTWTAATFDSSIAPGAKPYDVNLQQFSITEERKQAVDFSSGYYDVAQAFVALRSGRAAGARTLADLKGLQLGGATGTTSLDAIAEIVQPSKPARPYNDNDQAKLALANGQIDALAVDLPTALYLAAAELDGGFVVGQLPVSETTPEQFGFVLEKGSPLTSCVTQAVDSLREDGTLEKLQQQWLTDAAGAPVLS